MAFGDKLRTLIEECDLTQKKLALDLNIAPSTLGGYVQNSSEPDFTTLKILAEYFKVSTDYLLDVKTEKADNSRENELLRIFRSLSTEQKDICIEQCKVFLRLNHKKTNLA